MAKFRKKPVVVEAFQITKTHRLNSRCWPTWLLRAWAKDRLTPGSLYPADEDSVDGQLVVWILKGPHLISWDDWIIRCVDGELYLFNPDIFAATYDLVGDSFMPEGFGPAVVEELSGLIEKSCVDPNEEAVDECCDTVPNFNTPKTDSCDRPEPVATLCICGVCCASYDASRQSHICPHNFASTDEPAGLPYQPKHSTGKFRCPACGKYWSEYDQSAGCPHPSKDAPTTPKTLKNIDVSDSLTNVPDIQGFGDPDAWQLLCKTWSESEGWMKSTKVLSVPGTGVFLQVTTQQRNPDGSYSVAESVCFADNVRVKAERISPSGKIPPRVLEAIA